MADIWGGDQGAFPGNADLLTRLLQSGALAGLLNPEMDPMAQAAAARDAAGATLSARMGRRTPAAPVPTPFDAAPGALPDAATGGMPFAGLLNASGGFGPSPSLSSVPDLPPSTNDPGASEPTVYKDGVPLPRPRPAMAGLPAAASPAAGPTDDPAAVYAAGTTPAPAPFSMAPAGASAPSPGASAAGGGASGVLGKIFNPDHAATLLALGAGFSGAGSFGTGMRRAFANAVPAVATDRAYQQKQTGMTATMQALIRKGVPPDEAIAAVNNPDVLKATIGKYFETKPMTVHDVTGPLGDKSPVVFDPNTGKFKDMSGNPITSATDASGAGGSGGMGAILAPGVKYDPNLTGDEYLGQFSKDVQASVKAYMNGDVMPTGNPRQKALATYAKTIAQRYGQDKGIPVGDEIYNRKRTFYTQLGNTSPSSFGGQVKAFGQGIEHADALATQLEKLGNYDPLGIPSVGHGVNYMREALSSKQTGIAKEAAAIGQTLAGEVGKLFSGSAGGGVHERELTRNRFSTVGTGPELAGALEGTLETMEGGLRALEAKRDNDLGPNNNVKLVTADTEAKIARIRSVIARLKGEASTAPAAPITPLQPGEVKTINGVTIRRVN